MLKLVFGLHKHYREPGGESSHLFVYPSVADILKGVGGGSLLYKLRTGFFLGPDEPLLIIRVAPDTELAGYPAWPDTGYLVQCPLQFILV